MTYPRGPMMGFTRGQSATLAARLLCLSGALFLVEPALAEPSADQQSSAKAAWTKGKQLFSVRRFDEALTEFKSAASSDPKCKYRLEVARALVELGKTASAEVILEAIATDPEAGAEADKQAAKALSDKIVDQIPTLTVEAVGPLPEQVTLTINGHPAELGKPVREDPGSYSLHGEASGFAPVDQKTSVDSGEKTSIQLKFTASGNGGASAAPSSGERTGGNLLPAAIAFGVGGAGLAIGTIVGLVSLSKSSALKLRCDNNVCPATQRDAISSLKADSNASTAMFVIGGVGAATGLVLLLTVGRGHEAEKKSGSIVPFVWPGGAGVAGTF